MTLVELDGPPTVELAPGQDPKKRRQILEGARKVFHDKGFDGASMNDIARVAGVSKGTLYVYFGNKERLFLDLIAEEKRADLWPIVSLDPEDQTSEYFSPKPAAMSADGQGHAKSSITPENAP